MSLVSGLVFSFGGRAGNRELWLTAWFYFQANVVILMVLTSWSGQRGCWICGVLFWFESWLRYECLMLPRPYGPFGLVSARMSLTETHVVSWSSFWRDSCNQAKTHLGPLGLVWVRYMDPRHILLDDSCCVSFIVVTVMIVNCGCCGILLLVHWYYCRYFGAEMDMVMICFVELLSRE